MVQARTVLGIVSPEQARGKAGALGSGSGKGNDRGGAGKQRGEDLRFSRRGGQAWDSAANARVKDLEPGYQQTPVQGWVRRCHRKCSVAFSSATPLLQQRLLRRSALPGRSCRKFVKCRTSARLPESAFAEIQQVTRGTSLASVEGMRH